MASCDLADVKRIFFECLDSGPRESWPAFLDRVCAGNPALRERVQQLLDAHEQQHSLLDTGGLVETWPRPTTDFPGAQIGPYKLREQIGEGGMGVVYLAEQTHPVRRLVALKIIKAGLDTRQTIARFEAERQALALMDHPNIARILDAGTIPLVIADCGLRTGEAQAAPNPQSEIHIPQSSGRPYFVMELVRGLPITDYCDQARITVRERLSLFIDVCHAVQHAHQKGIIHRDLKPSNVMITLHDGKPVVKVIDFGIAKAMGQQLTDRTIYTAHCQLIGTPLYMSPEQAELSGLDVDTCSDVYSLGVLLYELLTGTTPFDKERLSQASFDEMRRIIREEEPARPSHRLGTLAAQACSTIASRRGLDDRRLKKLLRGELDWIVLKALEKDRNRRYESASALAADVQRYLDDQPVQALPPSMVYRLRKFCARHKAGLTTATVLSAGVLAAAISTGWFAWQHSRQKAAIEYQVEQTLREAELLHGQSQWAGALTAANRAESILTQFSPNEELRRRTWELQRNLKTALALDELHLRATGIRDGKGYDKSLEPIDEAVTDLCAIFSETGIDLRSPDSKGNAGMIADSAIRGELLTALDHTARLLTGNDLHKEFRLKLLQIATLADSHNLRKQVRLAVEHGDADALLAKASEGQVQDLPAETLDLVAEELRSRGKQREAIRLLRAAQLRHPGDFWINNDLGRFVAYDERLQFYSAALAARPESPDAHINLAYCLSRQFGRLDDAVPLFREAIRLRPNYAHAHNLFAQHLCFMARYGEAAAEYKEVIRLVPNHRARSALALLYSTCFDRDFRDPALAIELAQEAVKLKPAGGYGWHVLGIAHYRAGGWRAAADALAKAIELDPSGIDPASGRGYFYLSMAHSQLGELSEAKRFFAQGRDCFGKRTKARSLEEFEASALLQAKSGNAENRALGQARLAYIEATKEAGGRSEKAGPPPGAPTKPTPRQITIHPDLRKYLDEFQPQTADDLVYRGTLYVRIKDWSRALDDFHRAHELDSIQAALTISVSDLKFTVENATATVNANTALGKLAAAALLNKTIQMHREVVSADPSISSHHSRLADLLKLQAQFFGDKPAEIRP